MPVRPTVTDEALLPPTFIAPAVPVAVPESTFTSPEFELLPLALPEATETACELVEPADWLDDLRVKAPLPPELTVRAPVSVIFPASVTLPASVTESLDELLTLRSKRLPVY